MADMGKEQHNAANFIDTILTCGGKEASEGGVPVESGACAASHLMDRGEVMMQLLDNGRSIGANEE